MRRLANLDTERVRPMNVNLSAFPLWVVVAVAGLVLVQVTLDVIALVDLHRRPVDEVVGTKWVWAAVILLVSMLGPIIYLAAGRKPSAIDTGAASEATPSVGVERVADTLYGPRDGSEP
jgi:hypothetical protein